MWEGFWVVTTWFWWWYPPPWQGDSSQFHSRRRNHNAYVSEDGSGGYCGNLEEAKKGFIVATYNKIIGKNPMACHS